MQQACNSTKKHSLELLRSRVGSGGSWWSGRSLSADETRHSLVRCRGSTAALQGRVTCVAVGSAVARWQSACKVLVWQQVNLVNTVYL